MSDGEAPRPALALFGFDGTPTTAESFPAFLQPPQRSPVDSGKG